MPKFLFKLMSHGGYMEQAGDGTGSGAGSVDPAADPATKNEPATDPAADPATKSRPSDSEARLIKEVMEKKTKLKEVTEKAEALEAQIKRFEGIDPDAVRAMLEQQRAEQTKQLEAKGEWDRLKSQMAEEHTKEKTELSGKLTEQERMIAQLQGTIGELTVGNAFSQSQFIQQELALTPAKARVVFGGHFEFKDGAIVAYDKPAGAANRTPLVDGQGDFLSFESAIKKLVDADPERESLLKSKAKQGAGSKTNTKTSVQSEQKVLAVGKDRIAQALTGGILKK